MPTGEAASGAGFRHLGVGANAPESAVVPVVVPAARVAAMTSRPAEAANDTVTAALGYARRGWPYPRVAERCIDKPFAGRR